MSEVITRDVVEHTVEALVAEVAALTLDGWAVSKTNPGDCIGYRVYTVTMFRDSNTVEALRQKSAGVDEKPKMTRAEILAKARAARGQPKLDLTTVPEVK